MRPRHVPGWGALGAALLCLLCLARPARANDAPARVSVLTMGPGDHPFTRFGHNALLLEWDETSDGKNAVYNFGTFRFDGLTGVRDFMAGRFRYWLSVGNLPGTLAAYAAENRSLSAQELALTDVERAELYRILTDNARPEQRYYDYDYYRDNCSTRVRDALDNLIGGSLRRSVAGSGRLTFRQHTLALVGDTPWLYFGLDLALGTPTDRPTTRWEELFLPQELHDALAHATRDIAGKRVALVKSERRLLDAKRPELPRDPPATRLAFAGLGALLGGGFVVVGWAARRRRALRGLLGVVSGLLGSVIGLLGVALALFWASKHWAAHANSSLLACPPWALALGVLGLGLVPRRPRGARPLVILLGACLVSSALLLVFSLVSGNHESLRMALLFLPLWAGWLTGARLASAG